MDYSKLLSTRIQSVKPSGIRKFFDLLQGLEGAISLGVGEPDFITPMHIRQAGIDALNKGYTKYTSNAGLVELREAISDYMERRFNLKYEALGQILVTVGGSEGIDVAIRSLVNPGDEVVIPVPSFVCYGPLVEMAGGTPVYLELSVEDEFRLTPEKLLSALTEKTKAVVMPFPCNPTGGIMEREDLEAVAAILREREIVVISDEIYAELTYGGKDHVSIANIDGMYERTVVVNGFSKAYSMTGWRMGYLCGPKELIAQMTKLHQFGIMSAPTISQHAAIEAMRNGDADVVAMREEYDARRRFLVDGLRRIGLPVFEPKGAFYVFPDIRPTGLTSDEFCEKLLLAEKVAVISGSAFGQGGEGFVRCCYAASMENLAEALDRMERFLKSLKG